jgi:hypothetical protein
MGIDRIGKGSPGAPPEAAGAPPSREAERPFEAPAAARAANVAPVAPAAGSALERLRAGEIDLDGYLDAKVDEAVRHLAGLRPSELDAIRKTLRDQLATDPALSDLVLHATGKRPEPSED